MSSNDGLEKTLWSVALPGFGQILNGELIKGLSIIIFEILINVQSNLNQAIILSFQGDTKSAVSQTDYQWLMFYPCLYMFAIWDAYANAKREKAPYAFLAFVFAAYFGTIGVVYSSVFTLNGILLGPVFLPAICLILGAITGIVIRLIIAKGA